MINKSKFLQKGFTLIELLVVIGIISVLSAVAVPNFMGARERARDTERKSDLRQIQKAFELYKDTQSPVAYPTEGVFNALTCGGQWTVSSTIIMNSFPCDPSNDSVYTYDRNDTDSLRYTLYACLENKSDPDRTSTTADQCSSLVKYQITEP